MYSSIRRNFLVSLRVVKLASLRCFRREDTVNAVPELNFQYLFGPLGPVVCAYSWTMLTKSWDSWSQRLVDVVAVTRGAGNGERRRKKILLAGNQCKLGASVCHLTLAGGLCSSKTAFVHNVTKNGDTRAIMVISTRD